MAERNRVVVKKTENKNLILNEFFPRFNVTLKGGENIEYGQALSLDTATGKYIKYTGSGILPKTFYCGMDDEVQTSSDTVIQVVRSADIDGKYVKGIQKTSYDALDNLEKYGIYVKF
ncbi:hypothetical protein EII29_09815 [Leptotrichia sp. OH3620_COT-345]|uniref:hypothetical protein n=1 Tax=Leptotrichia sp. OH3620_COT-345 TaxID=2491048 RepID=UPI000F653FB6|nr:hypothetical protein [Leptotrichia sp. OH3620_COT-345]RRD38812.1 hypothetical protein EII29_09815 [Leptotrichia sp. OH3620_COT-345]